MIINIRGTSGSGKSTMVRNIMAFYDRITRHHIEGRRQPLWYLCEADGRRPLAVLGHYETACGGCDTISKIDDIYELVRQRHADGYDVLFEGLLIGPECNRTIALHEDGLPLVVIHLDLPLELCVDSVNMRRWAKNPEKPPVNPKNTKSKWVGCRRSIVRLEEAGVTCFQGDRDDCQSYAEQVLEL